MIEKIARRSDEELIDDAQGTSGGEDGRTP
jgi:hypothetical protein